MKRYLLVIIGSCLVLTASAMDEKQGRINSIKKDSTFLYSDVTETSRVEAMSKAYSQLQQEIQIWAASVGELQPQGLTQAAINDAVETIETRRDNCYRIFAYIAKDNVQRLFQGEDIFKEEVNTQTEDATPVEQKQPTRVVAGDSICRLLKDSYLGRKGGVLEQLKKARDFYDLKEIMEPMKQRGEIVDYGKYATMGNPKECYLIVYDHAGNIRALLDKGTDERRNLTTNAIDSTANYRGCGAIWFILAE